jgi:cysteine desulfurase
MRDRSPVYHDVYLDHAATAPVLAPAREAMVRGLELWANPSSPHRAGRAARAALEDARERTRQALGWPYEVVFTSGASEALALAWRAARCARRLVSPVEHEAVLRPAGAAAERLTLAADGTIDPDALTAMLAAGPPALVAIQHVNNETGIVQPLASLAPAVRSAGGLLLADCAQSAGKLPLPPADLIAIAGHKFGAPTGIGALLVRDFALLEAMGGQERGYRAGTENMPGALALAAALEAGSGWMEQAGTLRARLEQALVACGAQVIGAAVERIATIGAYRLPGVSAAALLIRCDAAGVAISAGSACSSGSLRTSHVLTALGVEGTAAREVIRVSIGRQTTAADLDRLVAVVEGMAGDVSQRTRASA